MVLSNFVMPDGLMIANVEGSMLTEEVNGKNIVKGKGSALVVHGRQNTKKKKGSS